MPHLKSDELDLFLSLNTKDDLKDFMISAGMQDKEIKEVFK